MKNIINKVPLPISGLMLGLAATGTLLASYGDIYKNIFGIMSGLIFIILLLKMVISPQNFLKELGNHLVLSIFPTYTMTMMILSTYFKPSSPNFAYAFWFLGLVLHALFIIVFTKRHIFNFDIKIVLPSYFIVYVGIVVASVTAPVHNSIPIGQILFWFGLTAYLVLLPIVTYRVFVVRDIKEPLIPTLVIFAAPGSLCLTGYLSSFPNKSIAMIGFLSVLSTIIWISVVIYMPKMLKSKFYPSFSSFTFPLVISAIAMKRTNTFLTENSFSSFYLNYLAKFAEILAVLVVLYVLFKYIVFLFSKEKNSAQN